MKKLIFLIVLSLLMTGMVWGQTAFFNETVGTVSGTTAIATHETNNGFSEIGATYSGTADIRTTGNSTGYDGASGSANVFFTNAVGRYLLIEDINTSAYSNISMTLGHFKSTTTGNNELTIEVSVNGTDWTSLSYSRPTGAGTSTWLLISPTGSIPSTSNLRIRFTQTSTATQFRIDDIKLYDNATSTPIINVSTPTLTGFTYVLGNGPSAEQSFTISGADLTGNVTVTAPANYQISKTSGSGYASPLTFTPAELATAQTVYVILAAGLAVGTYNGQTITASSDGATNKTVTCSGSVTAPPPPNAPVATDATNITSSSFSANWGAVSGATGYRLDVYTETTRTELINMDFEGYTNETPPPGWTRSSSGSYFQTISANAYSGTHYAGTNAINGWVQTPQITNPGTLTYWAKASSATSNYTIKVQSSPNGSDWTDQQTIVADGSNTGSVTSTYAQKTVNLNLVGDFYLRWFMSARSGGSLYFDDVVVTGGSTSYVEGYEDLNVGNVVTYPVSGLNPGTTYYYVVRSVNEYGISANSAPIQAVTAEGTSAPAVPVAIAATEIGVNSFIANWNASSGATSYRLDVSTVNTFASFVAGYNDLTVNGTSQTVNGLDANTPYYYRVRAYNAYGTSDNSNTITATTLASDPFGGYYNPVAGLTGPALKAGLQDILYTTHTTQFSYTATTEQLKYTDEDPNNTDNVIQIYTGWSVPKTSFGNETTNWNREHVWSKSHGDFGDIAPAGTDLHHLRPLDATVNSAKGNKDFDAGGTAYTDASPPAGYTGNTGCYTTTNTWEPRTEDKGDVARMLMYMAVRYDGSDTSYDLELTDTIPSHGFANLPFYAKQTTLMQWHEADPPDDRERTRNNRIQERQGNRNPFIDYPQFATSIWGGEAGVTVVQFNPAGAVVDEGSGQVTMYVEILNPSGTAATTADVILSHSPTTGLVTFTPATVTFSAGSSTPQQVTANVTNNDILEGTKTFVFTLQNVSGGTNASVGNYSSFSLAILDNDIPVPVATDATLPTMDGFTANWDATQGITDFEFDLSTSNTFATFVPGYEALMVTGTSLLITGLNAGTTYFYRLRAVYNESVGANSNVIEASTEAAEGLLLEENFAYTAGLLLTETGNWNNHSGTSNYIPVIASNLTYTSYPSITGNSASLTTTGEDVNRTFATQNSGSVYTSFLVNVTSAQTTGDYIFHYIPETYNTLFFRGRVFIQKESSSNNFRFGLSNGGAIASAVSTGYDYSYGNTYLVVLKYDFVEGDNNDVVSMWVNPTISTTEPAAQLVSTDPITSEPANLSRIALRQGSSSAAPALIIDGIRVATGWEYLFPSAPAVPTVTVSTEALTGFTYVAGSGPSAEQNFTVSGSNLEGNITITPPTNYEISTVTGESFLPTNPIILSPSRNSVGETPIYVRLKANLAAGDYNGETISITSSGVTDKFVACSGTVTEPVVGTLLLEENFEYEAGTLLTNTGNWLNHSGVTTNALTVSSPGLTYTNYPSVTGNSVTFATNGQDLNRTFTNIDAETIYASFLVNISSAQTGDHFFHYGPDPMGSTFRGRVYVKANGDNLNFGITKTNETPVLYSDVNYAKNVTHLLVLKYQSVEGADNDPVSLWVNPDISGAEPAPLLNKVGAGDITVKSVALRQGATSSAPVLKLDGIRVATSWSALFPTAPVIAVSETSLTGMNYYLDEGPSAEISFTVSGSNLEGNIIITPPANYQISTASGASFVHTNPITLSPTEGSVASTTIYVRLKANLAVGAYNNEQIVISSSGVAPNKVVLCNGEVFEPRPTLIVDPSSLTGLSYALGSGPSAAQCFTLSGLYLGGTVTLSQAENPEFEISLSSDAGFRDLLELEPDGDTLEPTQIFVRMKAGFAVGSYSGEISITADEADEKIVTCAGDVFAPPARLFFSEYIEGNSNNKALEIFNPEDEAVDLSDYRIELYSNGSAIINYNLVPNAILASNEVFVIANDAENVAPAIQNVSDVTSTVTYFNGNDAVALRHLPSNQIIDVIGLIGNNPGTGWPVAGTANATLDHTLIRKPTVTQGNTDWAASAGTNAENSEWIVQAVDTFTDLGSHTYTPGLDYVANPVFDPAAGSYFTTQNVTITTATENATVYYKTSAEAPWTVYTVALPVSQTTTIWAYAAKAGMEDSFVVSATYTFPINVQNIAELRQGTINGPLYRLTGEAVLTFQQATRNQKYIQDATGAIVIDDQPGTITTSYNLYDGITGITGTLTAYANLLQFVPAVNTAPATSTGNVVVPEVRTLESLTSADQAKLIKVLNVTIDSSSGNFLSTAQNLNVTQGETVRILRTFPATSYSGTPIPVDAIDMICLVGQFNADMQVSPRFLSDFLAIGGDLDTPELSIAMVGEQIQLSWAAIDGAVSYEILHSDTPDGEFTQAAVVNAPTTTWNIPSVVTKKFYQVIARDF